MSIRLPKGCVQVSMNPESVSEGMLPEDLRKEEIRRCFERACEMFSANLDTRSKFSFQLGDDVYVVRGIPEDFGISLRVDSSEKNEVRVVDLTYDDPYARNAELLIKFKENLYEASLKE